MFPKECNSQGDGIAVRSILNVTRNSKMAILAMKAAAQVPDEFWPLQAG
jgi:hypothetical protein